MGLFRRKMVIDQLVNHNYLKENKSCLNSVNLFKYRKTPYLAPGTTYVFKIFFWMVNAAKKIFRCKKR
jgi:hypothetical protein